LIVNSHSGNLQAYLDGLVAQFNQPDFIKNDPISIPHRFSTLQDIEITAFWTAMLAWGQRKTILKSANTLFELMDNAPLCKTYPNLDSVVFASCFNMLPKLTLSVGVNTPQADTV
jgi:hypothetical protein